MCGGAYLSQVNYIIGGSGEAGKRPRKNRGKPGVKVYGENRFPLSERKLTRNGNGQNHGVGRYEKVNLLICMLLLRR